MKPISLLFGVLVMATFFSKTLFGQHHIIPAPANYAAGNGSFEVNQAVAIQATSSELAPMVNWFRNQLHQIGTGITSDAPTGQTISLELLQSKKSKLGREGYELNVSPSEVTIKANEAAGIFYGMQTFLQLCPAAAVSDKGSVSSFSVPACSITDYPRFGWRGIMLDVSRNFMAVADVKVFIDLMAQYKFNVFHWHLTDDEGWRIEIKSLPKLTEVGACRVPRQGIWGERKAPAAGEKATDCGYYTQEQIREIVKYAADRHITIVPEIDVPGHSSAAVAAYPELSVTKAKVPVSPGYKFSEWYGDGTFKMLIDNTLNPTDEKVYEFLDKVFGEVAGLFPGQYIHSGGDECYHGYWEKSAQVQQFMKAKGIKDAHALQSYFSRRVNDIIKSKGKSMIGWDEILEGGVVDGAAVMSWRGMKGGIEAAKLGQKVVMSPTTFAYLDYMQGDPFFEPRVYASLSLKKSYSFEPVPEGVDGQLILGGQGNLWTEKVPHLRHATYMTYPRAWALAEKLWSPKGSGNWSDFVSRVDEHIVRAEKADVLVSKSLYDVSMGVSKQNNGRLISLECEHPRAEIFYTIDNTLPDNHAIRYTKPFVLPEGNIILQATTYIEGKPAGRVLKADDAEITKRMK